MENANHNVEAAKMHRVITSPLCSGSFESKRTSFLSAEKADLNLLPMDLLSIALPAGGLPAGDLAPVDFFPVDFVIVPQLLKIPNYFLGLTVRLSEWLLATAFYLP